MSTAADGASNAQPRPSATTAPVASRSDEPLVRAVNVMKSFGKHEVLKGIDLDVHPGEVVVLLGPSGSGKTTFLRCINQLETIDGGRIWVDGDLMGYADKGGQLHRLTDRKIAAQRREIGMVFQRFNLFPHMTALENVMEAPVQVKGVGKAEAKAEAERLLERVGLGDKTKHYPSQLSGGQQQRVAVARALVGKPSILLADEPTGNLDEATGRQIADLLFGMVRDSGTTLVLVTHAPELAVRCDRTIRLRDGRLEQAA